MTIRPPAERLCLAMLVLAVLAGCSTLKGRRVTPWSPANKRPESAAGMSYYLAKPSFALQRRATAGGKPAAPTYALQLGWQPDARERFEVGMRPGWFTNDSLELLLDENGRITQLNSHRTDETAQVVVGLTKLAAETAKVAAAMEARAPADKLYQFAEERGLLAKVSTHAADLAHLKAFLGKSPGQRKADAIGRDLTRRLRDAFEADVCPPLPGGPVRTYSGGLKAIVGVYAAHTAGYSDVERVFQPVCPAPKTPWPPAAPSGADIGTCATKLAKPKPQDPPEDMASWSCETERALESVILSAAANLKFLDQAASGAESTKVRDVLAKLRTEVASRIADVVNALADDAPASEIARRRAELTRSIRRVDAIADEALRLDDRLTGRALAARRTAIQRFLTSRIPSGANGKVSQAYVQFGDELNKLLDGIAGVVGRPPDGDLLTGTEVTSVVQNEVYVDRWARLDGIEESRRLLAAARVRYEANQAVFIVTPAKSEGAE